MFDFLLNTIELKEIKYSGLKRIFKTPDYLKLYKDQYSIDVKPLLFILIHHSHLKYFLSIVRDLENQNIGYSVISLRNNFENDLKPYSKKLIHIGSFYKKSDIYKSIILQFFFFLKYFLLKDVHKSYATLKLFKDYYLVRTAFKKILKQSDINLIIMYKGDGIYAQTIGRYIKSKNYLVKIIAIQHGLIQTIPQFKNLAIDEFWVWSSFFKNRLSKLGVKYKIKVFGDSTTDSFFNSTLFVKKLNNEIRVLFMPNHGNSHTPKSQVIHSLSLLTKYANNNNKVSLTIKPHPGDVNNLVKNIIKNYSHTKNIILKNKTQKININNYDLIIINNSAIGMEAAMNNIPLLILAENRSQIMVEQYLDYGFAEVAFNYDELVDKVKFIRSNYKLFQEKTKAFVRDMYEFRGESTKLILEELSKYS